MFQSCISAMLLGFTRAMTKKNVVCDKSTCDWWMLGHFRKIYIRILYIYVFYCSHFDVRFLFRIIVFANKKPHCTYIIYIMKNTHTHMRNGFKLNLKSKLIALWLVEQWKHCIKFNDKDSNGQDRGQEARDRNPIDIM